MEVPDHTAAIGHPAKTLRPVTERERDYLAWLSEHYTSLAARHADGAFPASGTRPSNPGSPGDG